MLEPIILKLLQLCTSLRKNRLARDALGLYKIAAQPISIPSIELVLKTFIQGAEDKLKAAQDEAKEVLGEQQEEQQGKKADEDEDDLELPLQPDTLLFESLLEESAGAETGAAGAAADGSKDKDRVERKIVTPWLRFAWEAYKTCLDVCKSNARLEVVYQVSPVVASLSSRVRVSLLTLLYTPGHSRSKSPSRPLGSAVPTRVNPSSVV